MRSKLSFGARVFRVLVRLLPTEFRGDFGEAMLADIDAAGAQGAGFWWREIRALFGAVVREHLDALRQDTKYALRMMWRTPGFTAVAVLMLALGTGVNVAMFSIVDAVLLRSPFPDPSRLARMSALVNGQPVLFPPDRYRELANAPAPLAAVAASATGSHVLTGQGDPMNVDDIECVSSSMFQVLGTPPLMGRTFSPDEDRPGAPATIVLSYAFWQGLGGASSILGSSLTINQTPVTVIGVMPSGFAGPLARGDVQGWLPLRRPVKSAENSGCRAGSVSVFARLPPGMSREVAQSALPGFNLTPLRSPIMDDVETPLTVLMVAVGCVLLIACFNVGGLQMERTLARRREMAVRLALGASRWRLVRHTLTENVMLALAGAAAGIIAATVGLRGLVSMLPGNVPYLDQIAVNGRVLAATIGVATLVGLVAGLLPIAETRRVAPASDLTNGTRSSERRSSWGRRALVVAEIAVSIVVLIGAALMVQTFLTLRPAHPGFDASRKLVMSVRLRSATPEASAQFFSQLIERVRLAPAIRAAEGSTYFPMSGNTLIAAIEIDGQMKNVFTNYATPGFFEMLKVAIVTGRGLSGDDTRGSMPVMVVNQALASRLRPDGNVVGMRVAVKAESGPAASGAIPRTIVGVLANTRSSGIHTLPRAEAYVPFAQNPVAAQQIIVEAAAGREAEAAEELRRAVRALDPTLPVSPPQPMESMIRARMGAGPFGALMLGAIAALAVGLAAIGLTATIGWWVRQRTRELGVRMALGASRARVLGLVFRQGMTIALLGIAAGCAAASGVTRFLADWIYGVTPLDGKTFAGCAIGMLLVAAAAVYVPVRRATAIDPVAALKTE